MKDNIYRFFEGYVSRFRSAQTADKYLGEIREFERFSGCDFEDADHFRVEAYRQHLSDRGIAATTESKKLHMLSAFGEFLYSKNQIPTNPFKFSYGAAVTYRPPEHIRVLSPSEAEHLFTLLAESGQESIAMLCRVILASGCGLSELLLVEVRRDVTFSEAQNRYQIAFHNFPPFQLSRSVSLPDSLSARFSSYLSAMPDSCPYLFYNSRGQQLKSWTVYRALRGTAAGITVKDLKATAQTMFAQTGAGEQEIASYTGHQTRWLYRYRQAAELSPSLLDSYVGGGKNTEGKGE